MSSISIAGNTSGSVTLAAPDVAGTTTLTLPATSATIATDVNGTLYPLKSGTAVASTSGTSITFTGIPSWVKRITVVFNGASTNGNNILIQLGTSSSFETTGYSSTAVIIDNAGASGGTNNSAGFVIYPEGAANIYSGIATICTLGANVWAFSSVGKAGTIRMTLSGGDKTLANTLTRIRITTANGTDTFDAGSINILYE